MTVPGARGAGAPRSDGWPDRAAPRGRRPRLSRLFRHARRAAAGLLVLAGALAAAAPFDRAQAQTTVETIIHETTMTVGSGSQNSPVGYIRLGNLGTIVDGDFTYGGGTFTIHEIYWSRSFSWGQYRLSKAGTVTYPDGATYKLVLKSGSKTAEHALGSYIDGHATLRELQADSLWRTWSADDQITVQIVEIGPPNNVPVFDEVPPATRSIQENSPAGTNIGEPVTATDADDDPLTYSLAGTDARFFDIDSDTGQLKTKSEVTYDFETTESYSAVTVVVSDGKDTAEIDVTVTLTDEIGPTFDEVPAKTRKIRESPAAGVNVGPAVTATDDDGEPLTYSLAGADAGFFDIDSGTGQLKTRSGVTYDYETRTTYSLTVRVSDGTESAEIDVTVTLLDDVTEPHAPEAPILTLVWHDAAALRASWAEVGRPPGGSPVTGYQAQIKPAAGGSWTPASPPTETGHSRTFGGLPNQEHVVRVRAVNQQGGAGPWSALGRGTPGQPAAWISAGTSPVTEGAAAQFTVEVSQVAPTGGVTLEVSVSESGDFVRPADEGKKPVTIPEGSKKGTLSVPTHDDAVDEPNGVVRAFLEPHASVVERSPRTVRVFVHDNDNGPPVFNEGASATRSFEESAPAGTAIGDPVLAHDRDPGDTVTYSLSLSGADALSFDIDPSTGQLKTKSGIDYDYDTRNRFWVTVEASDGTATTTISLIIDIAGPRSIAWSGGFTETAANDGSVEGSVTATLSGDTFTANWASNVRLRRFLPVGLSSNFTFDSDTQVTMRLTGRATAHAHADDVDDLEIRFSDGAFTGGQRDDVTGWQSPNFRIDFNDAGNGAPSFNEGSSTTRRFSETAPAGTAIGDPVAATDADADDTLYYRLGGMDGGLFNIDGSTGQLSTKSGIPYDRLAYSLTVTVSDGAAEATIAVTAKLFTAPGPPTNLQGSRSGSDGRTVRWSWGPPEDNGGSPVTRYESNYNYILNSAWLHSHSGIFFQDSVSGTGFEFAVRVRVRAVNATGPGPWVVFRIPQLGADPPTVTDTAGVFREHIGYVGRNFSATLPAADPGSGGGAPYGYGLYSRGNLNQSFANTINGLTFDPVTRVLSGTPAAAGTWPLTYIVTDGDDVIHDDDLFRQDAPFQLTVRPALSVVLSATRLVTAEGTKASYTIRLGSQPTGNVNVRAFSADPGRVTVDTDLDVAGNQDTLTFTPTNWDMEQTVTLIAGTDTDAVDNDVTVKHFILTESTDAAEYQGVAIPDLSLGVTELPTPEVTVEPGTSPVVEGTAATFTLKLSGAAPSFGLDVKVKVADVAGSDFVAAADEGERTVTIAAGDTEATVTVATRGDAVAEQAGDVTVEVLDGVGYTVGSPKSASVRVTDAPDLPPTVTDTAGVLRGHVADEGVPFSITLPAADPGSGNGVPYEYILWKRGAGAHFGENGLSFDPVTRIVSGTPQAASVHELAYQVHDGDGNRSRADSFVEETDLQITVRPAPRVVVSTTLVEMIRGTTGSYTIVLARQPTADVTVTVGSNALDVVTVDTDPDTAGAQDSLTFTPDNWDTARTVTVAAPHGADETGVVLTHDVAAGSAAEYLNLFGDDVTVAVRLPAVTVKALWSTLLLEGEAKSLTSWFRVTSQVQAPAGGLAVTVTVADAAGSDFLAETNEGERTVTIPAGTLSTFISLKHQVIDDRFDEPNGAVTVTVLDGEGYKAGSPAIASITITDDDEEAAPTVTDAAGVFREHAAYVGHSLTLTLPAADANSGNGGPYSYELRLRDDPSKSFSDGIDGLTFDPVTRVLSGTPTTAGTLDLDYVVHDGDPNTEDSDAFVQGAPLRLVVSEATVVTLSVDPDRVTEGETVRFTVTATITSGPVFDSDTTLAIGGIRPRDGGRVDDWQYVSRPEDSVDLVFAGGEASASTTITFLIKDDGRVEGEEVHEFYLGQSEIPAGVTVEPGPLTFVDAAPLPVVSIAAKATPVTEGAAAVFTVTASPAPDADLAVGLTVAEAAGSDFVAAENEGPRTVTILAGEASAAYSVVTENDERNEPSGAVTATLAAGEGYAVADAPNDAASVTVNDDDAERSLTIAAQTLAEAAGATSFEVTADGRTTAPFLCWAVTGDGTTATPDVDFTGLDTAADSEAAPPRAATVNFSASTTATVGVTVTQDALDEADETILVRCRRADGTGAAAEGTLTIEDDDDPPALSLAAPAPVTEGDTGATATMTFTVTLSAPSGKTVTVGYATGDDTSPGAKTATAGEDYTAASGTLEFGPGEQSKDIAVPILGDGTVEGSETLVLTLSAPSNATLPAQPSATGTIADDDAAGLTLSGSPLTLTEAAPGAEGQFTVVLDKRPSDDVTVALTATPPSGTITLSTAKLTFTPSNWDTPLPVTVTAVDDDVQNAGGKREASVAVSASGGGYGGLTDSVAVTVTDDDVAGVTVSPQTLTVAESGEGNAKDYTVVLNTDPGEGAAVQVAFASADTGIATVALKGGSNAATAVCFVGGSGGADSWDTARTLTVTAVNDNVDNLGDARTVQITHTVQDGCDGTSTQVESGYAGVTAPSVEVTVTDEDVPALSIADAGVAEDDVSGGVRFTVTMSPASEKTVTVDYATGDSNPVSAQAGADYTARSGTLEFGPGVTERSIDVPVLDDDVDEGNETFTVTLSSPTAGATLPDPPTATGTITDDDEAPTGIALELSPSVVAESGGATKITVTATVEGGTTFAEARTVTVTVTAGTATLGTDYTASAPAAIVIAAGQVSGETTFTLTPVDDGPGDSGDTVRVNGTLSGFTIAPVELTIVEAPTFSIADEVSEGESGNLEFTVRLDPPVGTGSATVDWAASTETGDTATAGADYTAAGGTLTFAAGEPSKTVAVPILDDALDEDAETFTVTLSNPTGGDTVVGDAAISGATATGTITDDDDPPALSLATPDAVPEGDAGATATMTFTVTLSAASGKTVTVGYATSDGTAEAGEDYTAASGTLEFGPGEQSKDIAVPILGDGTVEGSETLVLTLSAPSNAALPAQPSATGTIADDDAAAMTVSGSPLTLNEVAPGAEGQFTVVLDKRPSGQVTVALTVAPASGTVTLSTASLTFTPDDWATEQSVTVEAVKGVYLMSYVIHDGDADRSREDAFRERERLRVTVRALPAVSVADARADESAGTIAFTLTLDTPAPVRASVAWATADGTAKAGSDYAAASGRAAFAPGAREATVSVTIHDDVHDEGEEMFRLVLSDPVNLRIGDGEAVGTIVNSDPLLNAWLARFGRTVASQTVEALTERFAVAPGAASQVTLGGQRVDLEGTGAAAAGGEDPPPVRWKPGSAWAGSEWDGGPGSLSGTGPGSVPGASPLPGSGVIPGSGAIPGSPGAAENRSMTGREFLLGSSFHLTSEGKEPGSGRWTAWGRAALENFRGEDGGLTVDGEVVTGVLGADFSRGDWLGGVALTHSAGEGDLRPDDMPLDYGVKSTVTAVNPYLRVRLSDRVTAWGLAGHGWGGLKLTKRRQAAQDAPAGTEVYETDLTMTLGAVGARGELVTPAESGGYGLALNADAFWVRTESDAVTVQGVGRLAAADGEASRVRVALEGSRRFELEGGGTLTPTLEVGLRQDGGDAETGTGLELGGGLAYADPASGLSMDLKGRTLVAHAESGYREWGLSGAVKLQPGASGRGLTLTLTPAWGADAGGDRLWSAPDAGQLAPANGNADSKGRLETEIGYGLPAFGGGFTGTPYLGFGYSDAERKYRLGWRLTRPADTGSFTFSLEASRRETANDNEPEHGIGFRATARW